MFYSINPHSSLLLSGIEMTEKELTLFCACKNLAHVIQFNTWDDMLSLQVHLRPRRSIFGRIWLALQYVALKVGDAWDFEDTVLTEEDVRKIREFLDDFLKEA